MVGEIIQYALQAGDGLVKVVEYVEAGKKIIEFGRQPIDFLRGYFGPKQEEDLKKISEKSQKLLSDLDTARLKEPSPSVLTPLIEAACQESRDELQDLWAALLANAMVDNGRNFRREFIETIRHFEPLDAVVLRAIKGLPMPGNWFDGIESNRRYMIDIQNKGIDPDDWLVSCRNLHKHGCIDPVRGSRTSPTLEQPDITPFGKRLLLACSKPI